MLIQYCYYYLPASIFTSDNRREERVCYAFYYKTILYLPHNAKKVVLEVILEEIS